MDTKDESPKPIRRCPKCGSDRVAVIKYGMRPPNYRPKKDELVVFGGCVIPINAPRFKCLKCNAAFKKLKE